MLRLFLDMSVIRRIPYPGDFQVFNRILVNLIKIGVFGRSRIVCISGPVIVLNFCRGYRKEKKADESNQYSENMHVFHEIAFNLFV